MVYIESVQFNKTSIWILGVFMMCDDFRLILSVFQATRIIFRDILRVKQALSTSCFI